METETSFLPSGPEEFSNNPELFARLFRLSPLCLALTTIKEGRVLEASRAFCQACGYERRELIGRTARELEFWRDYDQRKRLFERMCETGSLQGEEVVFRTKTGEQKVGLLSLELVETAGETCALVGVEDVTLQREKEKKLAESEQRFSFLAETTGDALYRLRYDSMSYDYLSTGVRTLTGYTPEEINQISFSSLVLRIESADRQEISRDFIRKNRRDGKTGEYRADYLIKTKDGSEKWLGDHSFPWLDDQGRVIGSVGILTDITQRKRAEEEQRLRERLQVAVETAGAACHELNQPLQAVLMKLEMVLIQLDKGDPLREQLRFILKQAQRMGDITRRLNSLTAYRTKEYMGGVNILDILGSAE